jgi:hypothetical protein
VEPDTVRQDLVNVPPDFDRSVLEPELAAAVDAYGAALAAGDTDAAAAFVSEPARAGVAAEHARFGDRVQACAVVALAAIGGHRIVKLRLTGARSVGHLQVRWTPAASGWTITFAELVRVEPADLAPAR